MAFALQSLRSVLESTEQAAREIYYAMTFLPDGHPARANLAAALQELGVFGPGDVGLSDSVLKRKQPEAQSIELGPLKAALTDFALSLQGKRDLQFLHIHQAFGPVRDALDALEAAMEAE